MKNQHSKSAKNQFQNPPQGRKNNHLDQFPGERAIAAAIAEAEDQERQRLAEVLHDGLQPLMVAVRMHVACLRSYSEDRPFVEAITRIDEILGECLSTSRNLTSELSPRPLLEKGLVPAVRWLAQLHHSRFGLPVQVCESGKIASMGPEIDSVLFQSVRELLLNVQKHASATTAQIELKQTRNSLVCVVSDDGIGFAPAVFDSKQPQSGGLGLNRLKDRIQACGGIVQFPHVGQRGAMVEITIPTQEV